jgi:membrane fusion protein, multidrug efflux system
LQAKGLQGESLVAAAAAGLEEAKALVRMRETQVQKTNIVAPFDGFVQSQQVELGSIVNKGQQLFELVDLSPLVVTAYVTENDVAKIKQNANVEVTLVDGKSVQGKVRFLSSVSDTGTNTFPIEIEIENPVTPDPRDMMKAGISTEVKLMFDAESAIKVSPALLSLDKAGNLGVKTVDGDTVVFTPIDMIKAEQDGVWLGGFSGTTQVITRGQGFVRPGDKVNAVLKQAGN